MSKVSTDDLATILLGTEHSGNTATIYEVNFAVPNSLLGSSIGGNNSGFSFGLVQLDIGANGFAQAAYSDILDNALADGIIDQTQYDRLIQYSNDNRYDLDPVLSQTYLADQQLLNSSVFSRQEAREIVDQYNNQYLEQSLLGTVQDFLDEVIGAWGTESVFDYNHPDYHQAVAAVTSLANRFGSLTNTTANFVLNQPDSIDDIRAWFDTRLPTTNEADWQLVTTGANLFSVSDLRYQGVTSTISLGEAVTLLNAADSDAVAELFLKSQIGNCISNVNYTGSDSAAFLVSDFSISGAMSLSGGIFLSSGGYPGSTNTDPGFSVGLGTAGDPDLTASAIAAFAGAGGTNDASVLEFTIDVPGNSIDGISFDIVFGSEEFPEFSNSSFVDIAAIYVNGQNVALFNDNPATPLSVIDENLNTGNFNDNTSGTFGTEWDGFSNVLTVRAALTSGANTIKIAVADTGDDILDSGLYINNLQLLTDGATGGGVLSIINGDDGNNNLTVTVNPEEVNLFSGLDVVEGTSATFNNDIITGFGVGDILLFLGTTFAIGDIQVTFGSAILDIDTDQNGNFDTRVTLEGDFEGAEFNVENTDGNSTIAVSFPSLNSPPTAADDAFVIGADQPFTGNVLDDNGNGADLDPDSDPLSISRINGQALADIDSDAAAAGTQVLLASGAILDVAADGSFTYDPNGTLDALQAGESVVDGFEYEITDQSIDGTDTAVVTFTVNGVNDAPDAGNDLVSLDEDTFIFGDVSGNDSDVDGAELSYGLVEGPANGTLKFFENGTFIYEANSDQFDLAAPGEVATEVFEYEVSDGLGGTDRAFVSIDVNILDDGITLNGDGDPDNLVGTDGGEDVLRGEDGDDMLIGLGGADSLFGGAGKDNLQGGWGVDFLDGGADDDMLDGGHGEDHFFFDVNSGVDTIVNFQIGVDKILIAADHTASSFEELTVSTIDGNASYHITGGKIVLQDKAIGELSASDFIFE